MIITVASWNIAGAHTIKSSNTTIYDKKDSAYFIEQLADLSPDIVCLQETHSTKGGEPKDALTIARGLSMDVAVNSVNSPSHIDSKFTLGNSILTSIDYFDVKDELYPEPPGELYWNDGRPADTHHKSLQSVNIQNFQVLNTQMLPVRLFGFTYDNERGSEYSNGINSVMEGMAANPSIWCGDFNFNKPIQIYAHMSKLNLKESLPQRETGPSDDEENNKPDHILYSPEFTLLSSDIIKTQTDHYLCYAKFEV